MDNHTDFNATSRESCGTCRHRSGERRIELTNGIVRWVGCRQSDWCPHRDEVPRNCLQRIRDFCRRWLP